MNLTASPFQMQLLIFFIFYKQNNNKNWMTNLKLPSSKDCNSLPADVRTYLCSPVYVAVPKQNTEYQYWKHTEVSLPVWLFK